MSFADRLAVMRAGRLEQQGAPEETYLSPRTAFVAGFLGRTNLLHGQADGATVETRLGVLALARPARGPVLVSVRPEDLRLVPRAPGGADAEAEAPVEGPSARLDGVPVVVTDRAFHGHDLVLRCRVDGEAARGPEDGFVIRTGPDATLRPGDPARLHVHGSAVPLESSGPG